MERMVADKFGHFNLQSLAGMGFVFWGICNAGVYGLSMIMSKQNFDYHFAYEGKGKLM